MLPWWGYGFGIGLTHVRLWSRSGGNIIICYIFIESSAVAASAEIEKRLAEMLVT